MVRKRENIQRAAVVWTKMPCWCQRRMGRLVRDNRQGTVTQITTRYNLLEYCCWPCPSLYDYNVPSSDGYFKQDNAPCHKTQIISDWFLEHDNEFTLLKWPPQSSNLNPKELLWDVVEREIRIMDVQPTNLQQLRDAIMSIWTKISEECFQHLVESMLRSIKAVLKLKRGPTRY